VKLDKGLGQLNIDDQTEDTHAVIHHLVRVRLVHRQCGITEDLQILAHVDMAEACNIAQVTDHQLFKDHRLHEVCHVAANKLRHELIERLSILLAQPHTAARVPRRLAARFFFNLGKDAHGSLHLIRPLLRLLQEALVEEKALTKLVKLLVLVIEQVGVEATNVFVGNLLLHHFLNLFCSLFIARCHFLSNLSRFKVVHFSL